MTWVQPVKLRLRSGEMRRAFSNRREAVAEIVAAKAAAAHKYTTPAEPSSRRDAARVKPRGPVIESMNAQSWRGQMRLRLLTSKPV